MKTRKEEESKKTDDDFVTKLVAQIIKNVQIRITNVHICYEDNFTNPAKPFVLGITFSRTVFETQSTADTKYSPRNPDAIIYKLVSLENFSIYWNVLTPQRVATAFISNQYADIREELLLDGIASDTRRPPHLNYILEPITFTANAIINRTPDVDGKRAISTGAH